MDHIENCLANLICAIAQCASHTRSDQDTSTEYSKNPSFNKDIVTCNGNIPSSANIGTAPVYIAGNLEISHNTITIDMRSSTPCGKSHRDTRHQDYYYERDRELDRRDDAVLEARMKFFKANSP